MIDAIIPARAGSKRIKSKNIVDLGGHPLIAYTIEACKLSKNIDRIIVSTDCDIIKEISLKYGAEVPFKRPSNLASDSSSDKGFLKHFFQNIDVSEALLMRPTSPLRNPKEIDRIVESYMKVKRDISSYTGFRSMSASNHSPYKMFKIEDGLCKGFFKDYVGDENYTNLPNQCFPKSYIPNGYCDLVLRDTVKKCTSSFGSNIYGICTESIVDIDNHFELDVAKSQIMTKYDHLSVHLSKII